MTSQFRFPRRTFLCAVGGSFFGLRALEAQSPAEVLVAAIQDGGKVIYLRHAATNQREVDTGRLGDRSGQRNLSADGIRQAERLGHALRSLRVPLNEILASPVFRARDTAELAFGEDRDQGHDGSGRGRVRGRSPEGDDRGDKGLLRTLPGPGMNRVLVGHRTPLRDGDWTTVPGQRAARGGNGRVPSRAIPQLLGTITAERVVPVGRITGRIAPLGRSLWTGLQAGPT